MATRGRSYNKIQDWDPMKEDFNNTTYDAQYPDDDASEGVQLDHCRLYITNIPKGLNDEGLRAAFAKFGTLLEVHLSKDPLKRYGLLSFESPSEAKLAMMKMNRTEPLKLNVSIAHKHKKADRQWDNKDRSNVTSSRERTSFKEDTASVGSRGKYSRKEEVTNGDSETVNRFPVEEDMSLSDPLDASLNLELENLKLEQLKIREEQLMCKHRMLLLKQAERRPAHQGPGNTRCILPDGRIVVRNVTEHGSEMRDAEVTYAAGAGDSHAMPALQRDACRQCVSCGTLADQFCARCGVTPYCSARCQRRDWNERHKAVCHNLARLSAQGTDVKDAPGLLNFTPAPPLRRPHSPALERDSPRSDDAGSDRGNKNYRQNDRNMAVNRFNQKGSVPFNRNQDGRQNFKPKDDNEGDNKNQLPQKNFPRNDTPKHKPKENPAVKLRTPKPPRDDIDTTPVNEVIPPAKETRPPIKETRPPVKETRPPNKETRSPIKETTSPIKETKQPIKETTPPIKETRPPVKEAKSTAVVKELKESFAAKKVRQVIPKTYLIEHLSVGDSVLLSVDGKASESRTCVPGYVCLSMHEKFETDYQKLCEDYVLDCESDTAQLILTPGVCVSYLNPDDGGWYRARCLNPTTIALLDSGKIVQLKTTDKLKTLPAKYQEIPEFCCVLDAKVEVGANLKCTLVSKTPNGYKVTIENVDTGSDMGGGEVARWTPQVEYPPEPAPTPKLPEVSRPPLQSGARVILTDACGARACVRRATTESQRLFDAVLQDVVLYGSAATPLKEPPLQGQTVVAKFTDGLHYRALCRRTSVKQNKYQLEYVEYGNVEVSKLEMLYPCPQEYDLSSVPTVASILTLDVDVTLTPDAQKYLEDLKEEEMILTLPDGAKTAPSGSVASLTVVKTNENVQKKVLELSTPDWKKIEERGGDVIETQSLMFSDLECLELPPSGGALQVLDVALLEDGSVSACQQDLAHAQYVFTHLADRMAEYCNSELGRQPYLPKPEELCIAKCPPSHQWYRAAFLEQLNGPGGEKARILYVDTGYMGELPVTMLRKMVPEFVKGLPAVACHLEIQDFPDDPTQDMLSKARQYMKIDERGRGELRVSKCVKLDDGMYSVEAKDLLLAMAGRK